jgi:hypothetical protein
MHCALRKGVLHGLKSPSACVLNNLFRGENPFTAVEQFPDEYFDVNDPEINWASVAQNVIFFLGD